MKLVSGQFWAVMHNKLGQDIDKLKLFLDFISGQFYTTLCRGSSATGCRQTKISQNHIYFQREPQPTERKAGSTWKQHVGQHPLFCMTPPSAVEQHSGQTQTLCSISMARYWSRWTWGGGCFALLVSGNCRPVSWLAVFSFHLSMTYIRWLTVSTVSGIWAYYKSL